MSLLTDKADLSLKYTAHFNEAKDTLLNGSPDFMNTARKEGFQNFVSRGIPSRKDENYKYSNLNPRFSTDFDFIHQKETPPENNKSVHEISIDRHDSVIHTVTNGWSEKAEKDNCQEGVLLGSLLKEGRQNPMLVGKYYGQVATSESDPMIALNTAFAKDGYYLHVSKNTAVEKPILIMNLLNARKDTYVTQRNMVIIEPGAEVKMIICENTLNQNYYLSNSVTEIVLGENAKLDFYILQNIHNRATSINSVAIRQENNSVATTHTSTMHGGFIRNNLEFNLNGENAEANAFGMAFIDRKQHVDNFTKIIHARPHCRSNQIYKNVLDDEASGAFTGRIHVARDAQQTNALQQNSNLLLTDSAVMQTKPQLIIDADDVKCSHGATVGQLDKEALFYLQARGIGEDKAKLMLMNAFAHEVVQKIKVEALRDSIDTLIGKRLNGEIGKIHESEYI